MGKQRVMTFFVEIQCDYKLPGGEGARYTDAKCYSFSNSNPNSNSIKVAWAARRASERAREAKWKKTRDGWLCPHCAKR